MGHTYRITSDPCQALRRRRQVLGREQEPQREDQRIMHAGGMITKNEWWPGFAASAAISPTEKNSVAAIAQSSRRRLMAACVSYRHNNKIAVAAYLMPQPTVQYCWFRDSDASGTQSQAEHALGHLLVECGPL